MKFLTLLAATATVLLTGAASANAADSNMLTTTVEGPQGVVWTGQCPEWVNESDIDKVDAMCRNLGYRLPTDTLRTVRSLGGTKITDTHADGSLVNLAYITPENHWLRRNVLPAGGTVVTDCPIVGDTVDMSRGACTQTTEGPARNARAARKKPARAKHHKRR
jgi:hypothetical protein